MFCDIFRRKEFPYQLQEWQYEALRHFVYGNDHLISHDPTLALEHFQKGMSLLDTSDSSSRPIEFLITFSQVIAYDCLGFQDQCKQALGLLFLTISEYEEEDDQEASYKSIDRQKEQLGSTFEFLQNIVTLAPSKDVRDVKDAYNEFRGNPRACSLSYTEVNSLETLRMTP